MDDGPDPWQNFPLQKRHKKLDYFVGCLPWAQKGPPVLTPLTGNAPIIGLGIADLTGFNSGTQDVRESGGTVKSYTFSESSLGANLVMEGTGTGTTAAPLMYADLEGVSGISINELRESFQIQKLLERDARSGTRYPEVLKAHFGVTDPAMLVHQRPLFLGGGHSQININAVQQTQRTDSADLPGDTPQGNLAAYGTVSGNNHGFTQSFTEHGHIIGIINVRSDITYQLGLERYWSRETRYDFFMPVLSHLGEMAVLGREIFIDGSSGDTDVFGYQERWSEYRYIPSKISGLFRSTAPASLDVWHLAQDFETRPLLNQSFVESGVPIDRVVATPLEPDFLLDAYFKIRAARALPLYSTPGLIDHF